MILAVALLLAGADEPSFVARTLAGKEVRGSLATMTADAIVLGKGVRKKVPLADLLWLRAEGARMPPLPDGEQLALVSGGRIPVSGVKLAGESLSFRSPALGASTAPLASVAVIWRSVPERAGPPGAFLRRLLTDRRKEDVVYLRNGDTLAGTLTALGGSAEVEKGGKKRSAPWEQVAAIALNTDLAEKPRPAAGVSRLVLTTGERLTVSAVAVDERGTLTARTDFGAKLSVPSERLASLEPADGRAILLSALTPTKYEYFPYLDESSRWSADATEAGGALRVEGSAWLEGVSLRGHSRIEYAVAGHDRFEAVIGLDDVEGRRGKARVRLLLDGKPAGEHRLAWGKPAARVVLPLAGAKSLAVEVLHDGAGPARSVVDLVDARLIRASSR
jgi:hypothetical protein